MSTGQPIDLKRLEGRLLSLGITLTEAKLDMLYRYAGLLCEYNERLNLTAITDPEGIEEKHFIDSILPLKLFEIPKHASVIDIGTGAGFPGIPWKIAREDIDLCLFDSLRKRLDFLLAVLGSLGLEARLVHGRAEDFGKRSFVRALTSPLQGGRRSPGFKRILPALCQAGRGACCPQGS